MDDFDGGGDGFRSPMLAMMGMAVPILIMFLFFTLAVPLIIYLVGRWKQNREGVVDPQLGIKVALGFFRQLGYQFMLAGGFLVLYGITSKMLSGHRDILMRSLGEHGRIVLAPTIDAAVAFANDYGPEHCSVDVEPLEPVVERLRNAGSLFVGPWAPESAGDYATGANHVLPTGGLARSSGGLAVEAYGKFSQIQRITREGLAGLAQTVATLAEVEGLLAHRDAVTRRFDLEESDR